jgi:L-ascorbate metabolism protein UlaG (beta-lactamase superfamily)
MLSIIIVIASLSIAGYAFFQLYPPFGGRASRSKNSRIAQSANLFRGKFTNQIPTSMHVHLGDILSILHAHLRGNPRRRPTKPIQPERPQLAPTPPGKSADITWFGHSTFLLRIAGKTLLLDPMFSQAASPFRSVGPKRFSDILPLTIKDLPPIDAVVISHDHYDHLDYASIKQLHSKARQFFVPLGVAAHLQKWGISKERIVELDWWETCTFEGIQLACTPARHFSGRTLTDRFATLWSSWVITTSDTRIFFSGDSGYGPHFKQIGKKYGPFDLTLMECGQYDKRWPNVHMLPEQTVTAHQELRGKHMIPIHWGAFMLAMHNWTDPIERVIQAAKEVGVRVATPRIGQVVTVVSDTYPHKRWWEAYDRRP